MIGFCIFLYLPNLPILHFIEGPQELSPDQRAVPNLNLVADLHTVSEEVKAK